MAKKIYVVDDNASVRGLSILFYRSRGYETREFPDADSLLEAIANGDKPDLILMDTDMPGIKGYEACDRIKNNENTKDIKIIGVSGNITDSYEQKWREARGDHFISKPFDLDNLLNKTKELLGE